MVMKIKKSDKKVLKEYNKDGRFIAARICDNTKRMAMSLNAKLLNEILYKL